MIVALLFSAALLSDPAPQAAAATTPASAPAPAATPPASKKVAVDPDRVCKVQPKLGSRMPEKVCYSRAMMEERTAEDKANLDKIQNATPMNSH